MTEPMNISSPAAAFARQAKTEARVEAALLWAMRLFLADVEEMALRDQTYLSPAAVGGAWARRMGAEALATRLPQAVAAYVAESQSTATVPDQAYDTAMAVMTAATERTWAAQLTSDVLAEALSMDTPPVALVAATDWREAAWRYYDEIGPLTAAIRSDSKRGKAMQEAFDQALGGTGRISWDAAMRRDARTAVTGLDGIISGDTMRQRGVASKRWVTRRDHAVRPAHAAADGQTVAIDQPFMVDGYPMMHPGERGAPAELVFNCRCVMVAADETELTTRREAEGLADEVYRESRRQEPSITREMKALATETGQRMEGLEYRVKDRSSLARKIANDAVTDDVSQATAAANISDGVRYTMISTEASYARAAQTTLDRLRAQGWTARVKNAWAQSDRAYQGINVALRSPSGQAVELQFHTQSSFDAKMSDDMHGTYERQRVLPKSDPQWAVYEREMHDYMKRVVVPRAVTSVS